MSECPTRKGVGLVKKKRKFLKGEKTVAVAGADFLPKRIKGTLCRLNSEAVSQGRVAKEYSVPISKEKKTGEEERKRN